MPKTSYQAKVVPVDVAAEQHAKDTVQFYKLKAQKTGEVQDGPVSMRDFFSQAALWYTLFMQKKDNGGAPFPHCARLPKGKAKR